MGFDSYYEARDIVVNLIKKDLLGPVYEDELLKEKELPVNYYIAGKLYPQRMGIIENINTDNTSSSEDCGDLDAEAGISLSNCNYPSSFGISFSTNSEAESFIIESSAAKYTLCAKEELEESHNLDAFSDSKRLWKRIVLDIQPVEVSLNNLHVGKTSVVEINDGLTLRILLHKIYNDGTKTITVSMVNERISEKDISIDCSNTVFQPVIEISSKDKMLFRDVRRNVHITDDADVAELEMLYSKVGDYASGHGCAVEWEFDDDHITKIKTNFLPTYEILQMMPSQRFNGRILEMKYLADAPKADIISGLHELTDEYEKWISATENKAKSLQEEHHIAAKRNIEKCRCMLNTLNKSIDSLEDDMVARAFSLANEAMFMQRKMMLLRNDKFSADENIKWYPFQLAFFVQELISFADCDSDERKNVDLLWFPTGGGKTEAYLGIAAFVIFLRRLRNGNTGDGVTVLMRYTLRLLSFQQFERAAALICACEIIRRREGIEGGEIAIGLWAGMALTPNKIAKAEAILRGESDGKSEGNPVQFEKCPWCGSEISPEHYSCDRIKIRMNISCPNIECDFHKGLPVYLIDEEIYEHTPTFIVATVDKFAQVAQNYDTSALFGKKLGKLPPDLIIQDELHLISGPLGTITGLYEAAIKKLCEINGHTPKVVASTATIRNAKEQIKALYASPYTQFPPQGIDINDSFFAELSTRNSKPGRLYLGCMGIGTSPTTMMIRVMASLLYATRYIAEQGYDDNVVDSFWTQTGYFNTLRELGGAIIRVVDDIQDRFNYLRTAKFAESYTLSSTKRRYDKYKELTSREKSENIGNVIQKELKEPYKSDGSTNPYDFLLSSNMISVGVDVGRLGTMIVVGQPKTTSEYIQATSRVGRETPGLVLTTYNQAKSRDRSHYENFTQYHETFYRFVEATSVTPFSDRARDRALQALYVILCRNMIPKLSEDDDAANYSRSLEGLKEIRQYIGDYIKLVDPSEYNNAMEDLDEIEREWEERCSRRTTMKYRLTSYTSPDDALFDPDYLENSRFRVLNTMRSVETTVKVSTLEE